MIIETNPYSTDAVMMMEELSMELERITGSDGRGSFNPEDFNQPGALFAISYDSMGNAVGCGGFRLLDNETSELKRMYAKRKNTGIGTELLRYLEGKAKELGYHRIRLETRAINKTAVSFYEKNGYQRIPNYGKYCDNPEAVCFEKSML